ncbi:MAG: hypothetical protein DMG97_32785 [Acidobacteria bacterium]|nr:MAG: hypothetical protein DMG97_32785 [Acidobacteriota bacterium]
MKTLDVMPAESSANLISSIINLIWSAHNAVEECRSINAKADAAETGLWNGNGRISRLEALDCHAAADSRPMHTTESNHGYAGCNFSGVFQV